MKRGEWWKFFTLPRRQLEANLQVILGVLAFLADLDGSLASLASLASLVGMAVLALPFSRVNLLSFFILVG